MNEGIIKHHGIKGQKWGVRRFQNEDGSLTTEGKKRYKVTITKDPKRLVAAAVLLGTAAVLQANIGTLAIKGAEWYATKETEIRMNNIGVAAYAAKNNIPYDTNSSSISFGLKQAKNGKDFIDSVLNQRVPEDRRIG